MTVKETMKAIRALGATVSRNGREWRVNVPNGNEATAYYTDDPEDALITAGDMIARYVQLGGSDPVCQACGDPITKPYNRAIRVSYGKPGRMLEHDWFHGEDCYAHVAIREP